MRGAFLLGLAAMARLVGTTWASASVIIANGTIHGGLCAVSAANYFLAIPYAAPPTGSLRFAAPQPFNSTFAGGILNATASAPYCVQFGLEAGSQPQSEDCLLVDIWAPTNATSQSHLPVKIWLYGGYNQFGGISDPTYDGCVSGQDAVVVSVNYRVGPLGYLALLPASLSGNYGIQDQLLALQWVQENIAAFGGDPAKVLLFGQSAGAFDTFAISTLDQAPQLIKAAAMESSAGVDFATVAEAEPWNELFVTSLNCSVTSLSCLRSATLSQIRDAANSMPGGGVPYFGSLYANLGRGDPWGPLVDGKLIPVQPSKAGVKVPAIMGSNTAEGNILVLAQYLTTNLTVGQYYQVLNNSFGPTLAAVVNQTYTLSKFNNTASPVFAAISTIITDYGFRCPNYRALKTAANNGIPVWTYSFNHTPSCPYILGISPQVSALLGPTHTAEIPFVFGHVDHLPPPNGTCSFNAAEKQISAFFMNAWTSMASTGSPATAWPPFLPNSSLGINIGDSVVAGPVDYSMCAFWDLIEVAVVQNDGANVTAAVPTTITAPTTSRHFTTNITVATSSLSSATNPATRTVLPPAATGQSNANRLALNSVFPAGVLALFVLLLAGRSLSSESMISSLELICT